MASTTPPRRFADGDRVTAITAPGKVGTVVSAMLVGKRHPGYIYTIALDGGGTISAPQGLMSKESK